MNFLRKGFRKFVSDRHTERQTGYTWSLLVIWQRWQSHNSICCSRKHHAACKPNGSIFYRTGVMDDQILYCGNKHSLDVFSSSDLDLDPMTFIYELDMCCLEIHRICKYELPTSRLSKVIVWQTDIYSDRLTESTEIVSHAALRLVNNVNISCYLAKVTWCYISEHVTHYSYSLLVMCRCVTLLMLLIWLFVCVDSIAVSDAVDQTVVVDFSYHFSCNSINQCLSAELLTWCKMWVQHVCGFLRNMLLFWTSYFMICIQKLSSFFSIVEYGMLTKMKVVLLFFSCVYAMHFIFMYFAYTLWTIKKGGSTFVIITLENLDRFL